LIGLPTPAWASRTALSDQPRRADDRFPALPHATLAAPSASFTRQLVALKVEKAIARHNAQAGGAIQLSASVGMHTVSGLDTDDLLREADRRMYAAKGTRRRGGVKTRPPLTAQC
jgi:GGDEF domain-containing protein